MRIFLLISFLAVLCACNNDLTKIGQNLIPNDRYVGITTVPIEEMSTFQLDSFPTSNLTQLTVGRFKDKITGPIQATPYFQVARNPSTFVTNVTYESNCVYDSLTLSFPYTSSLAGDTTSYQKFELYQLKEYPRIDFDNPLFYNVNSLPLKEKISELTILPQKDNLTNKYFKINDKIGQDLFDKMRSRDDIYRSYDDFIAYFKGLAIVPNDDNSNLIAISSGTSLTLRCHYHIGATNYSFEIPALANDATTGSSYTFSNIQNNPEGTQFEGISSKNRIPFQKNNIAVIEGLNGYMLRIKVPFVEDVTSYKTIVKAEIVFKPKVGNYESIPTPTRLGVYLSDKENRFRGVLTDLSNNVVYGQLMGNQSNLSEEQKYVIDITDYYMQKVEGVTTPTDHDIYLLVGLPGSIYDIWKGYSVLTGLVATTLQRVVFEEMPILNIYYAKYE